MPTNKAGHDILFRDEYVLYSQKFYDEMIKNVFQDLYNQPYKPDVMIIHPDIFNKYVEIEAEITKMDTNMSTQKLDKSHVDPNGDMYMISQEAFNGWIDDWTKYGNSPGGFLNNLGAALDNFSVETKVINSQPNNQEDWIRQTVIDLQDLLGEHPLLEEAIRARLMNLPGYNYVNPA